MGRAPCCDKENVKRGPWSPEEDTALRNYLERHGTGGNWIALPLKAGLKRCGKSCRLRWLNYLRPNIKHGGFTEEEDNIICTLFKKIGSRWSVIASHLPGRTDNDVKNHWNTKLKKKLMAGQISLPTNNNITNTTHIPHSPSPSPHPLIPSIKTEVYSCRGFSMPLNKCPSTLPPTETGFGYTHDSLRLVSELTIPMPELMDPSDAYVVSPPQDASAASSSITVDNNNNYINWSFNGVDGDDGFFADFCFGPPSDLLSCHGFQEQIGEVAPNQTDFANLWATSETKPQGLFQSVTYS